ncbi:MAG: XamI family restriction endonuclease [Elusimicrobia bacterium CG_4_9_14_3_um_filter_62_55]|nr:MAG: restriction endonuclease [Elusimicrobia bacterium CG22_combo_CG10-13_8_21_14_all_63_91]PJA17581.1 MAG: XamI family restriction endonuclease [Elusimicrobia bacterium CG_4_10_14_0_2_um_filter_63_34]PJB24961.1 MAG: XamI family restriction endonuclease [Elusimicrobia bacterium CG_4_9_14_3_um_filter_62_55]
MVNPTRWDEEQLEVARFKAIEIFRNERLQEPVEAYSSAFDNCQGVIEELLETTVDLSDWDQAKIHKILSSESYLEAFRYLPGPPISQDDLKTLAIVASLSPTRLMGDQKAASRLVETVLSCLDRRRFPWVSERRDPTESEKNAAVLASAALMAYQRIQTLRRSEGKELQESRVAEALAGAGFVEVPRRKIGTLGDAPSIGEFCRETRLGTRKADFVIGLWDNRKMAIECKVSNSSINSVKRLNNDAAAKAEAWQKDFGERNIVPVAVLSGVYKLANLIEAQERGLSLFWAHEIDTLLNWIYTTRIP